MESKVLKEISDRFDEALREAEEFIAGLGYGVEAVVLLPGPDREWLAFRRRRDAEWVLAFEFDKGGVLQSCPLLEVSRQRKLKAAQGLKELIHAVHVVGSALGRDLETATKLVRLVLEQEMSI